MNVAADVEGYTDKDGNRLLSRHASLSVDTRKKYKMCV